MVIAMKKDGGLGSIELAAEITIGWLRNQNTHASINDVVEFLCKAHAAIHRSSVVEQGLDRAARRKSDHVPAVTIQQSLASKDYIISMIDGGKYKTMRRHLAANGLTPEEYLFRYNLPSNYPTASANYSKARKTLAHATGLGKQTGRARKKPSATKE